jgi:hypothetical protein
MKRLVLLLHTVLATSWLHGAVITLNNNNPSPGQYTTYAAAEAASVSGDTILVHGSALSYGAVVVSKSLAIIGPGHRPMTNGHLSALFSSIGLSANGIQLTGLRVVGGISGTGVSGILITHTRSGSVSLLGGSSASEISLCVLDSFVDFGDTGTGITIRNSHFTGGSFPLRNLGGSGSKTLLNNVFEGDGSSFLLGPGVLMSGAVLSNNIFFGLSPNSGVQSGCVYNNNLTFSTANNALPPAGQTGSGNIVNANPLFVGAASPSGFDYSRNYRLQAGSPCLGSGTNGSNIGLYDGSVVFSMSGEPMRPQTISVTTPTAVPFGGAIPTDVIIRKSTPDTQ